MRIKFDEQLILLNREMISMGALCEDAISMATKALIDGNMELIPKVKDIEREIDLKEREIESHCLKLLIQQQPVAKDLRQISSVLKMLTDMERIGDQSVDIVEIISLGNITIADNKLRIRDMATATIKMVKQSIDAFVDNNIELAHGVIAYDDVVDELFNEVKRALIHQFGKSERAMEYAIDILMIAKYFERIGDHAVNIAEWVVFSVTGKHKDGDLR